MAMSGMMPFPDGWGFNMGTVEKTQPTTDGKGEEDGRDTVAVGFIFSTPVLISCCYHHESSQVSVEGVEVHLIAELLKIKYGSDGVWRLERRVCSSK